MLHSFSTTHFHQNRQIYDMICCTVFPPQFSTRVDGLIQTRTDPSQLLRPPVPPFARASGGSSRAVPLRFPFVAQGSFQFLRGTNFYSAFEASHAFSQTSDFFSALLLGCVRHNAACTGNPFNLFRRFAVAVRKRRPPTRPCEFVYDFSSRETRGTSEC